MVKHYGTTTALDGLDLTVAQRTVYGLLGPNGAGKTTAVRVLATLLRADGGRARVVGHDVTTEAAVVRRIIGLTGQYAALDEYLTGRSNLVMIGRLSQADGARPRGGGPTSCSSSSTSATPPSGRSRPTRAACGGALTWRRA